MADDGSSDDMENVEMLNSGKWTPEQALLSALKYHEDIDHVAIVVGLKNGAHATICANANAKDLVWAAKMLDMRSTAGSGFS